MIMINAFFRRHWPMLTLVAAVSMMGPIISLLVLSHINELASGGLRDDSLRPFATGVGWLVALLVVDLVTQYLLARLGAKFVAQLRIDISQRFIDVSYENLLNRTHTVSDALVGDIWRIAPLVLEGPMILYSIVFGLLCSAYLLVISPALSGVLFCFFGAMMFVFLVVTKTARAHVEEMRRIEGELGEQYRSISEGKKELSLNADRARHFSLELLLPTIRRAESVMAKLHLQSGA